VLPAVAYLEMVHAALVNASGGGGAGDSFFQIKNAVWARPLVVEGNPVRLDIVLVPKAGGEVDFSIRGPAAAEGEEPILYCRGSASLGRPQEAPKLDCAAIQAECSSHVIDSDRCYEIFSGWGLAYGPAFRAVQKIHVGERGAFSELLLPEAAAATLDHFVLHPSLLDAAQQSALGLLLKEVSPSPSLPFALEELRIFGVCTASMRSYVRRRAGNGTPAGMLKLDLDLCDEEGNVRAAFRGLTTRALPRATTAEATERAGVDPPSGRETRAETENASYDEAFYKSLVAGIARGEVSKEQMHSILELKAGGDHG
jgi:polyketide synthase PksN